MFKYLLLFFFSCLMFTGWTQQLLNGKIFDEKNVAIPFAKIFVKNNAEMRTIADANGYYEIRLYPGEYFLVINATGYNERETYVVINDVPVNRDLQLFSASVKDLKDVEITAKKSNPGREIMLKVVEKRDSINLWNYPHAVEAYTKATEKIDRKEKETKDKKKNQEAKSEDAGGISDPFEEEEKKKRDALTQNMNLVEVQLTRYYSPPNKVKEIRNAYDKRGTDQNLYYTTTVK